MSIATSELLFEYSISMIYTVSCSGTNPLRVSQSKIWQFKESCVNQINYSGTCALGVAEMFF